MKYELNVTTIFLAVLLLSGLVMAGPGCPQSHGKAKCATDKCSTECPAGKTEVTRVDKDVTVTGTIACSHCDLNRGTKCQTILITPDNHVYQFCPDTIKNIDVKSFTGTSITVKGTVHSLKDADSVIHVDSLGLANKKAA